MKPNGAVGPAGHIALEQLLRLGAFFLGFDLGFLVACLQLYKPPFGQLVSPSRYYDKVILALEAISIDTASAW